MNEVTLRLSLKPFSCVSAIRLPLSYFLMKSETVLKNTSFSWEREEVNLLLKKPWIYFSIDGLSWISVDIYSVMFLEFVILC